MVYNSHFVRTATNVLQQTWTTLYNVALPQLTSAGLKSRAVTATTVYFVKVQIAVESAVIAGRAVPTTAALLVVTPPTDGTVATGVNSPVVHVAPAALQSCWPIIEGCRLTAVWWPPTTLFRWILAADWLRAQHPRGLITPGMNTGYEEKPRIPSCIRESLFYFYFRNWQGKTVY